MVNITERSSPNERNTDTKLPRKWILVMGLVIVFTVEFLLRDFLLPESANDTSIGLALVGEWVALCFLVLLWVPRVEKKNMMSIGLGRFKLRYLWWGVLVYLLMLVASSVSGFLLESAGLPSLRSLQPMIKAFVTC
jgi:magnesium-transporting ATPase (P-type)